MTTRPPFLARSARRGELVALLFAGLVLLGCPHPRRCDAAPVRLDPAFGTAGKVTTDFGGRHDLAFTGALLADGKIVAAGQADPSGDADFALARYLPDGKLDPSFGTGGKVTTNITINRDFAMRANDVIHALLVQHDGKLVAVGQSSLLSYGVAFALARYLPDGKLDPSFGTGGIVTTQLGVASGGATTAVLQADGKIVAVGLPAGMDNTDFVLVRYLPSGAVDPTFGNAGVARAAIGPRNPGCNAGTGAGGAALDARGRIVVVGQDACLRFAVARFTPGGSLDRTFGKGGIAFTKIGASASATAIAIQPDGKLVVGGQAGGFALVRYLPDGALDPSFGRHGVVTTDVADPSDPDNINALALLPGGQILAAGYADQVKDLQFALARYRADGSPDLRFGRRGVIATHFGPRGQVGDAATVALPEPDGGVILIGATARSPNDLFHYTADFALARYRLVTPGRRAPHR